MNKIIFKDVKQFNNKIKETYGPSAKIVKFDDSFYAKNDFDENKIYKVLITKDDKQSIQKYYIDSHARFNTNTMFGFISNYLKDIVNDRERIKTILNTFDITNIDIATLSDPEYHDWVFRTLDAIGIDYGFNALDIFNAIRKIVLSDSLCDNINLLDSLNYKLKIENILSSEHVNMIKNKINSDSNLNIELKERALDAIKNLEALNIEQK